MAKKKILPNVDGATPPAREKTAPVDEKQPEPVETQKGGNASSFETAQKLGQDLEAKLAAAEEQANRAEQKSNEIQDSLLRTAAEYENFRKRSQREHESAYGNGISCAACELLPVLDTLEAAAMAETTDEEYKKGVLLTLAKCSEVFKKLGIHEIDALGEPFDPELHNAVMQEAVEGTDTGIITRVMQKGYTYHDKVIRHAMVAVAP